MNINRLNIIFILIGVVIIGFITGCGNKKELHKHNIITIKQGENIVINPDEITDKATYYNYEYDDHFIQMFAFKASDKTVRMAFNTCGACNPSPDAYFIQKGDHFECQACGNKFHIDSVGLTKANGCAPISILDENKIIESNQITISSEFIEEYNDKFKTINIYEN